MSPFPLDVDFSFGGAALLAFCGPFAGTDLLVSPVLEPTDGADGFDLEAGFWRTKQWILR